MQLIRKIIAMEVEDEWKEMLLYYLLITVYYIMLRLTASGLTRMITQQVIMNRDLANLN